MINKFFLIVTSSFLLGSENVALDLTENKINDGIKYVGDIGKNKLEDLTDNDLLKGGINHLIDMVTDKSSDAVHTKSKDLNWFRPTKTDTETRLEESINQFFRQFNRPDPISEPIEIHFLGGKATPSAPILETHPSSVEFPALTLEDRPIDYSSGGLHAAKNLGSALKNASHGETYRYLVALETTSPLLSSAVKQIQTWANQLNAMSIHSYDMAAALVPGMWPKIHRANTYVCEHELIAQGKDLIEAKSLCQGKKKREEHLRKLGERNDQIFAGSFNVAEKILSQMGIGADKELLMNMTGTIVSNGGRIDYYPPLHKQVIALIREGRKIENGYRMQGHNIEIERSTISINFKPQKSRILNLFKTIQEKLYTESDFTEEEKSLLATSHFPMASFITLITQYKGNGSTLILGKRLI